MFKLECEFLPFSIGSKTVVYDSNIADNHTEDFIFSCLQRLLQEVTKPNFIIHSTQLYFKNCVV